MKAVLDVHYGGDRAGAACVMFGQWTDGAPQQVFRAATPLPAPYLAGRFYRRELPCLLAVLQQAGRVFDTVVIDGYVHLDPRVGKGLGLHLHEALAGASVVIGVAKNPLKIAARFVPVYRGRSRRPLFVSSMGCPLQRAADAVARMHGDHRIPTMLRAADREARAAMNIACR